MNSQAVTAPISEKKSRVVLRFTRTKGFEDWAPATSNGPEVLVELNARRRMFVASTLKAVILCERLRQLDSPFITRRIAEHELTFDENVWSPGRAIFNPPDLSGLVSERTAMEAMVIHSDNTATVIVLKQAGTSAVRQFIASIGLKKTMIPDSTRVFAAYLIWSAVDRKRLMLRADRQPFGNYIANAALSLEACYERKTPLALRGSENVSRICGFLPSRLFG